MNDIEKRFDLNTIVGLAGMVLARLVSPLLSFFIIVLVARMWGQEMLGKYNTVWVWLILFRSLSIFGLGEYISKNVGANRDKVAEYQTHGLLFGFFSSQLATIRGSQHS